MTSDSTIQKIVPWIYRLLFISFFLPMKWQTGMLIVFAVAVAMQFLFSQRNLHKNEFLVALLLGSGYLLYLVWLPMTPANSRTELFSLIERKFSLFILPLIFVLFSKLSSSSWKPHLSWFVGGALATALYGNAMILYEQVSTKSSFALNHVAYRVAFERLTHIHPTYFGMYICFAIGILWIYGAYFFKHRLWLSIVIQLLLLIALLLLMPKAAILALCLLFAYAMLFLFKISRSKKIYLSLLLICGLCLFYIAIPVAHQRIDEVFFFAENNSPDVINNSMNMRRLIFQEDLSLLQKHWLLGLGPSQLQEQLNLFFYLSSFYAGQALGSYNTHNEYLNQWLSFGLIGAILFIFILFIHYRKAFTTKNTLYLFLLIILSVTFFTENILSRQHGVVFFSLFTSLFFFIPAISKK